MDLVRLRPRCPRTQAVRLSANASTHDPLLGSADSVTVPHLSQLSEHAAIPATFQPAPDPRQAPPKGIPFAFLLYGMQGIGRPRTGSQRRRGRAERGRSRGGGIMVLRSVDVGWSVVWVEMLRMMMLAMRAVFVWKAFVRGFRVPFGGTFLLKVYRGTWVDAGKNCVADWRRWIIKSVVIRSDEGRWSCEARGSFDETDNLLSFLGDRSRTETLHSAADNRINQGFPIRLLSLFL